MFCENCGTKIEGYAAFCPKCGAPVGYTEEEIQPKRIVKEKKAERKPVEHKKAERKRPERKEAPAEKQPFPVSRIVAIVLGVCLAGAIGFIIYQNYEKNNTFTTEATTVAQTTENPNNNVSETAQSQVATVAENTTPENNTSDTAVDNTVDNTSNTTADSQAPLASDGFPDVDIEYQTEDANAEYGIDPNLVEDYSKNLNPSDYELFYSGIGGVFNFRYPKNLFNNLVVDESSDPTEFGNNHISYNFSGSKGSVMNFTALDRTDDKSMVEMARYVAQYEDRNLSMASKIQHTVSDDHATIIYTGYADPSRSTIAYDVFRIDDNYVFILHMVTPQYTSEEDKVQKGYVTECVYRYCGWSGTQSEPRTYPEYFTYITGKPYQEAMIEIHGLDQSEKICRLKMTPSDGYVNMRSGPGTEYDVITQLKEGWVLEAFGTYTTSDGRLWYKTQYRIDNEWIVGWVAGSQVTVE